MQARPARTSADVDVDLVAVALPATDAAFKDDDDVRPALTSKNEPVAHAEIARGEASALEARDDVDDLDDLDKSEPLVPHPPRKLDHRVRTALFLLLGAGVVLFSAGVMKRLLARRYSVSVTHLVNVAADPSASASGFVFDERPLDGLRDGAASAVPSSSQAAHPDDTPPPSAPAAPAASASSDSLAAPATASTPPPVADRAPAPAVDPADALTGAELLAKARAALAVGNNGRAATLAQKATKKGAGGSAWYVLGAAWQGMGAKAAAKNAYKTCASSGCPEAGECASILENM